MPPLIIRPATANEFQVAIDWAAAEGWNPGLDDLSAFHSADPDGFLMGFQGDKAVSSISVVRYDERYGFLGFYIVHPDVRGTGVGIATWNAGMAHLEGCTVGLDGVVAQQENYIKSGFKFAGRNVRYAGTPALPKSEPAKIEIKDVDAASLASLVAYDRICFPAPREAFIQSWASPTSPTRQAKVALLDGELLGYGVIRTCQNGYKIGPLFAEDEKAANALLVALCQTMEMGAEVSLDTPEDNSKAVTLAKRFGLAPVFETARMYKGEAPKLPLHDIYGITTFELG